MHNFVQNPSWNYIQLSTDNKLVSISSQLQTTTKLKKKKGKQIIINEALFEEEIYEL